MSNLYSLTFSLMAQFLFGILLWALPLPLLAANAEASEGIDSSQHPIYFPRRGELRRCLVTSPRNCIFSNGASPTIPSVVRDISLNYRKSAFLAEISIKLAMMGEYNLAKAVAQVITFPQSRISALVAIAAQQAKTQAIDQVQQTLTEATQIAQTAQWNGSARAWALTQIAVQYATIGQVETADHFFALALQPDPIQSNPGYVDLSFRRGIVLADVATGLLATGQTSQAEELVNLLLQEAQGDDVILPISPSILEPLLTVGEHDFAIRLVQAVSNPTYRTRWQSEICLSLVDVGEYDRAVQIAQRSQPINAGESGHAKQIRPSRPLSPVIIPPLPTNIRTPSSPQSEACLWSLQEQRNLADAANSIIGLVMDGETTLAIALAQGILSSNYKMLTLTELAIALAQAGEPTQSEYILSQALEIAKTVDRVSTSLNFGQGLGKMQIAVRLAESGQFSKALDITDTIEDDSYKVLSLLNIAEQYSQTEEPDQARELLVKTIEIVGTLQCPI